MKKNYYNIINNFALILVVFCLSSCQTPRKLFHSQKDLLNTFKRSIEPKVQKTDKTLHRKTVKTKIIEEINNTNIKNNKQLKQEEKTELDLNIHKKRSSKNTDKIPFNKSKIVNKNFRIEKLIGKNNHDLVLIIGKPDLKIKHGLTTNYQYHWKKCHVDFFLLIMAEI